MNGQKLKFIPIEPKIAPVNARIRNTEKSNIGRALTRSATTKPASASTVAPRPAALVSPSSAPCVIVNASPSTASDSVTIPATSSVPACGSRDSRTAPPISTSATAASGAWTRNTHGQLASATIAPPTIGPKPRPIPNTIPQIPNARPRSRPSRN